MKPIAIFQPDPEAPPAFFETWLAQKGLASELFRIDRRQRVPSSAAGYSGLCFMGGGMSVNDPLPWIDEACALIRDADTRAVPVLGHCLGGQLLARALGGSVRRNAVKELGWHRLRVTDKALADAWLGALADADIEWFQWHGDTFDLPPGAKNFLASDLCVRQAFVVERPGFAHLGMQFHCEMTASLVSEWVGPDGQAEIDAERRATGGPGVQSPQEIRHDAQRRAARLQSAAAHLYVRWSRGLNGA
jgi:GMP synthase-like glutamine amidotransferase